MLLFFIFKLSAWRIYIEGLAVLAPSIWSAFSRRTLNLSHQNPISTNFGSRKVAMSRKVES
ncbi:hypothetical protein YC2023_023229 [Brassica napus]